MIETVSREEIDSWEIEDYLFLLRQIVNEYFTGSSLTPLIMTVLFAVGHDKALMQESYLEAGVYGDVAAALAIFVMGNLTLIINRAAKKTAER